MPVRERVIPAMVRSICGMPGWEGESSEESNPGARVREGRAGVGELSSFSAVVGRMVEVNETICQLRPLRQLEGEREGEELYAKGRSGRSKKHLV